MFLQEICPLCLSGFVFDPVFLCQLLYCCLVPLLPHKPCKMRASSELCSVLQAL